MYWVIQKKYSGTEDQLFPASPKANKLFHLRAAGGKQRQPKILVYFSCKPFLTSRKPRMETSRRFNQIPLTFPAVPLISNNITLKASNGTIDVKKSVLCRGLLILVILQHLKHTKVAWVSGWFHCKKKESLTSRNWGLQLSVKKLQVWNFSTATNNKLELKKEKPQASSGQLKRK